MQSAQKFVSWIGGKNIFKKIFKDGDYLLLENLKDCKSILDLGCGDLSTLKHSAAKIKIGVDINTPALNAAKKGKTHSKYIHADIRNIDFKLKSFDAVILIGVIEHMPKKDGSKLLKKMESWAKKRIIISYPNGFSPQESVKPNIYQKHISSWQSGDLGNLGFKVYGITGAKFMYKKKMDIKFSKNEDKYALRNMRFKPQLLFFIINAILQLIVYYRPNYAATIFAVKNLKK